MTSRNQSSFSKWEREPWEQGWIHAAQKFPNSSVAFLMVRSYYKYKATPKIQLLYHYLDYTCITYGTVPCLALFSSCTMWWIQDIIVSWRSVRACFTNDPLPIQIGQEYVIKLVKCNFQGGWLIQLIRSWYHASTNYRSQKQIALGPLGSRAFACVGPSLWNVNSSFKLSGVSWVFRVSSRSF